MLIPSAASQAFKSNSIIPEDLEEFRSNSQSKNSSAPCRVRRKARIYAEQEESENLSEVRMKDFMRDDWISESMQAFIKVTSSGED